MQLKSLPTALLFVLIAAALMCTSCASGGKEVTSGGSAPGVAKKTKVGIVFDKGGRGDKSFNDSAWRGIEKAKDEFGIEEVMIESKHETEYEENLSALADQGCELVFGIGFAMKDALTNVASNYPNVKFALVDDSVEAPNVRALIFKEEEGSFLVGYLAGLMTKTGKVGFVGGIQTDLITKFYCGYAAGVRTANPSAEILPEKYTGNWDNVDTGKVAANILFRSGADIVYHAAGKAGLGVIAAAQDQSKFAIGVDSDQDGVAPGFVLTSMIKGVDQAVYATIKDAIDGKFTSGTMVFDLKAGGVGISPLTYTKEKVGDANLAKLEEMKGRIVSGEIKVPATRPELERYLAVPAE